MKNSFNNIHQALRRIYDKHRRMYRENRYDSKQLCCMWSIDDPPDIIEGTEPISDLEDTFDITIDDDEALELYDMTLDEAARRILEIRECERLKYHLQPVSNLRMKQNSNTIGDFISARKSLEQDRAQAIERIKEIDRVLAGSVPVSKPVIGKVTPVKKEQAKPGKEQAKPGGRRVMNEEAKQKIAAAQRKAWAARKAKKGKSAKSGAQGSMSAESKKKLSDAMRKAWAKRKALKK